MMMPNTYPREIVFGLAAADPMRIAVVAAAGELQLPTTSTDASVSVTVDSPTQAYRFGLATRKYLNHGQTAPTPIAMAPQEGLDTP